MALFNPRPHRVLIKNNGNALTNNFYTVHVTKDRRNKRRSQQSYVHNVKRTQTEESVTSAYYAGF